VPSNIASNLQLMGYNVYRNGTRLNSSVIVAMTYPDMNVPSGEYEYCVTAVYAQGESIGICQTVDVAVGLNDPAKNAFRVYPNPVKSTLNILSDEAIQEITLNDFNGRTICKLVNQGKECHLNVSGFEPGIYTLKMSSGKNRGVQKVVISR
jgi:hypothetical protein